MMNYVVTTSNRPKYEQIIAAKKVAEEYKVKFVKRKSIGSYVTENDIDFYYILDKNNQLKIYDGKEMFFFHPSMSKVRQKNLKDGQRDHLIESINPAGDEKILDLTFGLGSEALLMAKYLTTGTVTGIEASIHIYRIVSHGLRNYPYQYEWLKEAASKIEIINMNMKQYLKDAKDNSFDVVYCDPMFDIPILKSNSLNPIRKFASYDTVEDEDFENMRRISRDKIIIKSRVTDRLFKKINEYGFENINGSKRSGIMYGVMSVK